MNMYPSFIPRNMEGKNVCSSSLVLQVSPALQSTMRMVARGFIRDLFPLSPLPLFRIQNENSKSGYVLSIAGLDVVGVLVILGHSQVPGPRHPGHQGPRHG